MILVARSIAVYGFFRAMVPVRQRFWKKRKDGIRQRYWKKTKRKKAIIASGRYEFTGKGRDLYRAVIVAQKVVPKGYVRVSADKFVEKPYDYGFDGVWIEKDVESG